MNRAPGYYWVRRCGHDWEPALWTGRYWYVLGRAEEFSDEDMDQIGDAPFPMDLDVSDSQKSLGLSG